MSEEMEKIWVRRIEMKNSELRFYHLLSSLYSIMAMSLANLEHAVKRQVSGCKHRIQSTISVSYSSWLELCVLLYWFANYLIESSDEWACMSAHHDTLTLAYFCTAWEVRGLIIYLLVLMNPFAFFLRSILPTILMLLNDVRLTFIHIKSLMKTSQHQFLWLIFSNNA